MVVTKSCAIFATAYRQSGFDVFWLRCMEVFFQVRDHLFAGITVSPQECVIIANAVYTLTDLLLT
jgi:hypothetical protein